MGSTGGTGAGVCDAATRSTYFYPSFSIFRPAAIGRGVYKSGLDANARSPIALELGPEVAYTADFAWSVANREF